MYADTRYEQPSRLYEAMSYGDFLTKHAINDSPHAFTDYMTYLYGQLASGGRTIYSFADSYHAMAREEHSMPPGSQRLPSEREAGEMIALADHLKSICDKLRITVQQSNARREEMLRQGPQRRGLDDDDVSMYDVRSLGGSELKKRRGVSTSK